MIVRKLTMTQSGAYYINIPISIINELGWSVGDSIAIKRDGDKIILKKLEEVF